MLKYLVLTYSRLISPFLHVITGPTFGCRYYPTCSQFAISALREAPPFDALRLIVARLLRCHPLSRGGYDPVEYHIESTKENAIP